MNKDKIIELKLNKGEVKELITIMQQGMLRFEYELLKPGIISKDAIVDHITRIKFMDGVYTQLDPYYKEPKGRSKHHVKSFLKWVKRQMDDGKIQVNFNFDRLEEEL